jgi:esterase/lipase superfamily enzyme
MLFITNRVLNQSPKLKVGRKITFKIEDNQAQQSVYFCRRNKLDDYEEIGSENFFNELRDSSYNQILLYLHGYSNLPEPSIFPRAELLQWFFDQEKRTEVVVIPMIWPCDDDKGMVQDYFDDQIAADASGVAYARVFEKFIGWRDDGNPLKEPCLKRINILAHSMGNRVLRSTFDNVVHYYRPGGMPLVFRNIFLAAPDLVNESLEPGQEGRYISEAARNVVVYYASDDLALRASKVANLKNDVASRRLGHTGPEDMAKVAKNVYAVDCDDINNKYDPVGHTYFLQDQLAKPGLVFRHMWEAIRTGRVPMETTEARTLILTSTFFQK